MLSTETRFDIESVEWSEPRIVETRDGRKRIRTWNILGQEFWDEWRRDGDDIKRQGYSVSKFQGVWILTEWRDVIEEPMPDKLSPDMEAQFESVAPKLFNYQRQHTKNLILAILKHRAAVDTSDTGCHAKGTKILMHDGRIKNVEDVQVGDELMGWDGTTREVLLLSRGREPMARIIPTKGESFVVNQWHILTLQYTKASLESGMGKYGGAVIDITVDDWLKLNKTHKHCLKLFRVPASHWPKKRLRMQPYHLGVLLGDGCITKRSALQVCAPEPELRACAQEIAAEFGCRMRTDKPNSSNPAHRLYRTQKLWATLIELGLSGANSGTKFIPEIYKTGATQDRAELLAGLIDTDGHLTCGGFDYISKSRILAEDVAFVARSLGLAAYVKPSRKGCQSGVYGDYWRVFISGHCEIVPTRIPRKKADARKQSKSVNRTGFTVELLPPGDFYGFSLDGDGRYCMGDFTVTHNTGKTYCALAAAAVHRLNVFVIAPIQVLPMWRTAADYVGVELVETINYEKLRTGNTDYVTKNAKKFAWNRDVVSTDDTLIVFDEVHRCKDYSTQNCKMAIAALQGGYRVLALSATAADNPLQMKFVALATRLIRRADEFYGWVTQPAQGCRKGKWGLFFVGGKAVLHRLHQLIFPEHGSRMRIAELGDQFPQTKIIAEAYTMESATEIQAAYDEMHEEIAILEAREEQDKGANILTAQLRARQRIELLKVPTLCQMAEDAVEEGHSVVIFLNFDASLDAVTLRLGTNMVIRGGQTPEDRERVRLTFQRDEEHIVICNIRAGGIGISLHGETPEARTRLSLISPSYSGQDLKQALGRVHRAGGAKSVQKIVFADGVGCEIDVMKKVRAKITRIDALNNGIDAIADSDLSF